MAEFSSWDDVPLEKLIHPTTEAVDDEKDLGDKEFETAKLKSEIKHLKLELSSLQSSFSILENEKEKCDEKIAAYEIELTNSTNENFELKDQLWEERRLREDLERRIGENSSQLLDEISTLKTELQDLTLKSQEEKLFYRNADKFSGSDDLINDLQNQIRELNEIRSNLQKKLELNEITFREKESKYAIEIENLKLKNEKLEALPPIPKSMSFRKKDSKIESFDFERQCEHLESVISKLEAALEEKSQIADDALKQLQEKTEEDEIKRLKHLEEIETLNAAKDELQSQVEPLTKEKNFLNALINQLEVKDPHHPGHTLKLKKNLNFVCTVCRRTGSGWAWKCTNPICKDSMHISCAK